MGIIAKPTTARQELADLQHQADYALWMADTYRDDAIKLQTQIDRLRQEVEPEHTIRDGCCPVPCRPEDCGRTCPICGGMQFPY